jgi:cell division protein FtsW
MNKDIAKIDHTLYMAAMALALGGLIMIYSGSSALAYQNYNDGAYFFKRQLIWLAMGTVLGVMFYRMEIEKMKKYITPLLMGSIVLLLATHIHGLGHRVGGAARWLKLGPFSFQPFEAVKLFYVLYCAYILSGEKMDINAKLIKVTFVTGVIGAGLIWQRDLGGAAIIMAIFLAMVLIAGVDLKYFLIFIPIIVFGIIYFIKVEPYRLKRWFTYLNPWQDPLGAGWQTIQSLIAIGSGGQLGVGIFESQQKFYYLPTPHTDFVFSIIGEELGLWGALLVLVAFFFILQRGFYIALNAREHFLKYLSAGLTLMIIVQALVNIYVATGLLPPKGTTLPFLSFGGSSLIANVIAIGILLSISKRVSGART